MSVVVTRKDILSVPADAAVLCIENKMRVSAEAASLRLEEAGGPMLRRQLDQVVFLPVGQACAVRSPLPDFRVILAVGAPRWRWGEDDEIMVLRKCYRALFAAAEEAGCRSVVTPVLSAVYYGFPKEYAARIAREEASRAAPDTVLLADTEEMYALLEADLRQPEVVAFAGWYRDRAAFLLENGRYAMVDMRPENRGVWIRTFVEPCYRRELNRRQEPLPADELVRLLDIYREEG